MPDKTTDDRIADLEAELNRLKSRKNIEAQFEALFQSHTEEEMKILWDMINERIFNR